MAKNRYLIFQHLFNYQIYKIEGNNFREITDEVFIDEENTTYCFYGYDMSRIGVGHFDTGNDFDVCCPLVKFYPFETLFMKTPKLEVNFLVSHSSHLLEKVNDLLKKYDGGSFQLFFYHVIEHEFYKVQLDKKRFSIRGTTEFGDILCDFIRKTVNEKANIYVINELFIYSFVTKNNEEVLKITEIIEKKLRNKILSFAEFSTNQLLSLCFSVLYQIVFQNRKEFAFRDYRIYFEESEFQEILNEIYLYYKKTIASILEIDKNAYFVNMNKNKVTHSLFKEAFSEFQNVNFINFNAVLPDLIKYHSFYNRVLDIINANFTFIRYTNCQIDVHMLKTAPQIKKSDRIEMIRTFEKIISEVDIDEIIVKQY